MLDCPKPLAWLVEKGINYIIRWEVYCIQVVNYYLMYYTVSLVVVLSTIECQCYSVLFCLYTLSKVNPTLVGN